MTLFDPYSHTRIQELRQEQLARTARRRAQLKLDSMVGRTSLRDLVTRIAHRSTVRPGEKLSRQSQRPALDS